MAGGAAPTFGLLGPIAVQRDGRPVRLGGTRQRTALALLLLEAGRPVPVERLVDAVWDEAPPPTARKALQVHLSGLRRALAGLAGVEVVTVHGGYSIHTAPDRVDLHRFRRLVAQARAAPVEQAAALLRTGLALWRGRALADLAGLAWVDRAVAGIHEEQLAAVDRRIDTDLALGRHADLVPELTALVADHPLREHLCGQLMLALYRSGRTAEATTAYRHARERLVAELGVEPGPRLQRLHRAILTGGSVAIPPAGRPPAARPTVPRQLPADLTDVIGRGGELGRLTARLAAAERVPAVVAIVGAAGAGKTTLAVRLAHGNAAGYPDGQLFAPLHGTHPRPAAPADVLSGFLGSLGAPAGTIPAGVDERAALFRSRLAGRRVLVLLDDAAEGAQVRPLLPGEPGCAVVITSRRRLDELELATVVALEPLTDRHGLELLAAIVGEGRIAAEPEAARGVVRYCGGLPLALRIAGARLAAMPGWRVSDLRDRLADRGARLSELSIGDLSVRDRLAMSYHRLEPDAARIFRLAALFEGPDLPVPAITVLADRPAGAVERVLDSLAAIHLVRVTARRRYAFPELLQLFARERAAIEDPPEEHDAALARLAGWYGAPGRDAIRTNPPARIPADRWAAARDQEGRAWVRSPAPEPAGEGDQSVRCER